MSLTGRALENVENSMRQDQDFSHFRRRRTEEWFDRIFLADQNENARADGILSQMHSRICAFCDDVLNKLADNQSQESGPLTKPLHRLLDSSFDGLIEWGDDYEVWNGNLDEALKDSQDLRQFTIRILISISKTLTNDLLPATVQVLEAASPGSSLETLHSKARELKLVRDEAKLHTQSLTSDEKVYSIDDRFSESSSAHSDDSSLEDVLESLKTDVEALIELGPCLEDPIRDTIVTETAVAPYQLAVDDTDLKYHAFLDGIRQKYPHCDPGLAQALSKALYDSTMRLHEERQAANTEAVVKLGPLKGGLPKDSGYETSLREASQRPSNVSPEDNTAEGSSYARTLASFDDGDDGVTRTPFPSQPKGLKTGDKFPCIACGRPVSKSERGSAWRRHLLSDLRPWICCQVSCDCARIPYRTKNEWLVHLQAQHEVHPHWNDKTCPFCTRFIEAGGREMIRHVERHLKQLSLAALPANPGDDNGESESEHETESPTAPGGFEKAPQPEDQKPIESIPMLVERLEDHPLYGTVQEEDGLWHCPWEAEGYCEHRPSVLRADFDKYLAAHLDSQRCKVLGCKDSGRAFATLEILHLHEQAEHGLHKGGGRFLCTSPGCGRSRPGNGFASAWVQLEHIKSVHANISGLPPLPEEK